MLLAALLDAGADADAVRGGARRARRRRARRCELSASSATASRAAHVDVVAAARATRTAPGATCARSSTARGARRRGPRERAHDVFAALARAEGPVHGVAPERSTSTRSARSTRSATSCGVALALESLGVDELVCSPLPTSRGFVGAAHGRLPLPAPATLELLRGGAPLCGSRPASSSSRPTGAAVVAALARAFGPLPAMRLERDRLRRRHARARATARTSCASCVGERRRARPPAPATPLC